MKPVPIMQYLDHFGRVGQVEARPFAQAPAPTPAPFKPRTLRAVPDPEARGSAPMSRALREIGAPRDEGAPPPRPRPRAAPSEAEIEARIAEAYERGCRDGAVAAAADQAEAIERELAGERERGTLAQLDFQLNEYAHVAEMVSSGLQEIEQRVAEVVARLVEPLVARATADRIVEALCDNLARLRVGGTPSLIKIRGPERVLAALRERVAYLAVEVEYVADHGVEVSIEADDTTIRSQLQPWSDLIASLAR
jgi:hypothetical protein